MEGNTNNKDCIYNIYIYKEREECLIMRSRKKEGIVT